MEDLTASQVGSKLVSIIGVLETKFYAMSKKSEEELDVELLIKLSHAVGYQAQIYAMLLKDHIYERRLERLENAMSMTDTKLAMELSPVIIYKKDLQDE